MPKEKPHYFVQNPSRDDRTRLARGIDILLSVLLLWFTASIGIMLLPLPPVFTGILTILALAPSTALVVWYQRHRNKALHLHRDIWHCARKCRENLKEMGLSRDFYELAKELMEKTFPDTGLTVLPPDGNSSIDLSGYIRNRKVGVMCKNPVVEEHKTTVDEIKKFYTEISQAGFDNGIAITTGSFSDEARRFVRRIRGQMKIHLIDGHTVLRMAKKAAHPVFPDEKWHDEKEERISSLGMALSIKENIMTSRRKALPFIVLGIVFTAISALQGGFIGIVYTTAGIINLFIGFSGLILSYLRKNEPLADWL